MESETSFRTQQISILNACSATIYFAYVPYKQAGAFIKEIYRLNTYMRVLISMAMTYLKLLIYMSKLLHAIGMAVGQTFKFRRRYMFHLLQMIRLQGLTPCIHSCQYFMFGMQQGDLC